MGTHVPFRMLYPHQLQDANESDSELGKVVLGPPGLQAHLPVRRSTLGRVFALLRRRPLNPLYVSNIRVEVFAQEDDDGSMDLNINIVNFDKRSAGIDQVALEYVRAGGYNLSVTVPFFIPPADPIAGHGHGEIYLRIPLAAPAIRLLLKRTQPAQNLKSSPHLEVTVGGTVLAHYGKRAVRSPFVAKIYPPFLQYSCPSATA